MKTKEEITQRINEMEILLFEADQWVQRSLNNLKMTEERLGLAESDVAELDSAIQSKIEIRAKIDAMSWIIE